MRRTLKWNRHYFALTVLLFGIEILIARYAHDKIIRPYAGDFLVVLLIYCFVRSFLNTPYLKTAWAVLAFAFAIETMQYFHAVNRLGLAHYKLARIILGTSFEWTDLAAYTAGILLVIFIERALARRKITRNVNPE